MRGVIAHDNYGNRAPYAVLLAELAPSSDYYLQWQREVLALQGPKMQRRSRARPAP